MGVVLTGEPLEFRADFGGGRRCSEIGIAEVTFEIRELHVREPFEDVRLWITVHCGVNLRVLDGLADSLEEIEDRCTNLDVFGHGDSP
jgi:hypothetical protein